MVNFHTLHLAAIPHPGQKVKMGVVFVQDQAM